MAIDNNRVQRARSRILDKARTLARSGRYLDYAGVIAALEPLEGFDYARPRFSEAAIRDQLNRLCAMAQEPPATFERPGRRQ